MLKERPQRITQQLHHSVFKKFFSETFYYSNFNKPVKTKRAEAKLRHLPLSFLREQTDEVLTLLVQVLQLHTAVCLQRRNLHTLCGSLVLPFFSSFQLHLPNRPAAAGLKLNLSGSTDNNLSSCFRPKLSQ
ncbi:hypothetical protein ILYODFUR_023449 [Ilyodon furcidens]|uniref:Uncharacterized protein n=1 Tax=Ilyodon furcidens TaxID=33524 RepID=A0ABV0TAG6_9TELE